MAPMRMTTLALSAVSLAALVACAHSLPLTPTASSRLKPTGSLSIDGSTPSTSPTSSQAPPTETPSQSAALHSPPLPPAVTPKPSTVVATRTRARTPPPPSPNATTAGGAPTSTTSPLLSTVSLSLSSPSSDSVSPSRSKSGREGTPGPPAAHRGPSASPSVAMSSSVPATGQPVTTPLPASTTSAAPEGTTVAPTKLPTRAPRTKTRRAAPPHTVSMSAADRDHTFSISTHVPHAPPQSSSGAPGGGTATPAATTALPTTSGVWPPPTPTPTGPRTTLPPGPRRTITRAAARTASLSLEEDAEHTRSVTQGSVPPPGRAAIDGSDASAVDVPVVAGAIGVAVGLVVLVVVGILIGGPALLRRWRRRRHAGDAEEAPALPMADRTNQYRWYDDAKTVAVDVEARSVPDTLPHATAMLLQVPVPSGGGGDRVFLPAVTGTVVVVVEPQPPVPHSEDASSTADTSSAAAHRPTSLKPPNPLPDKCML